MTLPDDNFGKGHWNRRRNVKKYTTNMDGVRFHCDECKKTGYIRKAGKDIPCPACSRNVKSRKSEHGKTRIVYA